MKLPKSIAFGLPVVAVAVIVHFVLYMYQSSFMAGVISAIGLIILAFATSVVYMLATSAKEDLMPNIAGYMYVLTILILSNFLRIVFTAYIAPIFGL